MTTPRGVAIGPLAGLTLAVAAIGWLDYATGADLSFALFYLVPIAVAGLWLNRSSALGVALACAAAWAAADFAWRGVTPVAAWNAFTRLGIFVAAALMLARLRVDRRQLLALHEQLQARLAREQQLARTDPVTELPNSRAFHESLERALERARRSDLPVALAYLDLDDFKAINDRFGHAEGDRLLQKVAQAIDRVIREGDLAARVGGDEFAVLLRHSEPDALAAIGERLVREIGAALPVPDGAGPGVSVGVAFFERPPATAADALRLADQAMYLAKADGKGFVRVARAPGVRHGGATGT